MKLRNFEGNNKAIEFAATATQGGAVVFHTGEWQRPIMDAGIKNPEKAAPKDRIFSEYEKEFREGANIFWLMKKNRTNTRSN